MDVVNKFFDYKKKSLSEYVNIVYIDSKDAKEYIEAFIDTYINTYYYHYLDAYYDKPVTNINQGIIIKEMQAKKLELSISVSADKIKTDLINYSYSNVLIAIMIDLLDLSYLNKIQDFKDALQSSLVINSGLTQITDDMIDKLGTLVKENVLKEKKFFSELKSDSFAIKYYTYISDTNKCKVALEYNIDQLEKNYRKVVLDKNFDDSRLSLDRLKTTINLFSIDLLYKVLNHVQLKNYFIDLPLVDIKKKNLEELINSFSNPKIKDNIVFVINYNDYVSNKSLFKGFDKYKFAILVDFSKVISIEKRLTEIEEFDLFRYIIVDGVKSKDYQFVENFVIKGKEKFTNELIEA